MFLSVVTDNSCLLFFFNHLKYFQICEEVQIQANGPSLGPNSGPVAFHESELILRSLCWSNGGDHISVLAAGFGAVLRDGGKRPSSVPCLPDERWKGHIF